MTEVGQPPLLGGRYELGGRIGTGGMADVRRGVDVRLGREVAVKVLRPDLARDPSFQARFRREAQAAASLNAASIVSVYDTGEDPSGIPYIVMEFVAGRTLRDVVHEEGRLLPQRALELTADICTALEVAHAAGIVHRDIKPANVMLTPSGQVKVMDFGIARAAADTSGGATQTAAVIGTAAYLSPEQARGDHVDARSDLYSTGCLLFELVSGEPPFTGDSAVAVAYQHVREEPEPPSAFDGTLPPEVDAVVLKAMAKDPAARYQSAAEMRADLLRARAGQAVAAPAVVETSPAAVAAVPILVDPRRRRTVRGLVLAAFLLLLVGIAAATSVLVRSAVDVTSDGFLPTPAVVGLDQRTAVRRLAAEGLRVGSVTPRFDEAPVGQVLDQTPEQDIVVPPSGTVDLVVSRGVETTVVPLEAVGTSRAEAEALLAERELTVAPDVVAQDGFYEAGRVLAVAPAPGRQVRAGSVVTLTVASGRVPVPDVTGRSQEEAVEALRTAGFDVRVELQYVDGPAGQVLSQSPDDGTRELGRTVTLAVSQTIPPPPVVEPAPPPPAATPAPAAAAVPAPG